MISLHQDAELFAARLKAGDEATYALKPGRKAWLQVARGAVEVNGVKLKAGDGAAVSDEKKLVCHTNEASEVLLFDLK